MSADGAVTDALTGHRTAWLTTVAKDVTTLGTTTTLLVGGLVVAAWACRRERAWWPFALTGLGLLATDLVVRVLKVLVDRARPPARLALVEAVGGSFPSAHAAHAASLAAVVVVLVWWTRPQTEASVARLVTAATAVAATLAVAWSRIYLGVHWMSDTVAGIAIAWVTVSATAWSVRRYGRSRCALSVSPASSSSRRQGSPPEPGT